MPNVRRVLTAAAVLRYRPGAERREIPDGGAPGLRLVIQPSGAKSWAMRFRRPNGDPAKLTLGAVDLTGREAPEEPVLGAPLSLAAARRLAAEVHRQRALGRDVVADYDAEKHRRRVATHERGHNTFGAATRRFVDEHARPKTRRWRETARMLGLLPVDLDAIRHGLAERWNEKPAAEITGHDIHEVIDECRRRGVPGLGRHRQGTSDARARAMFACLSKFFGWLVAQQVIETNPCVGVQRPATPQARERVLSDREVALFWSACESVGEPFGQLLKLLLATGQRRDEVARMTYAELGLDDKGRPIWTLPSTRTKNKRSHIVPLSPLAHEIVSNLRPIAGEPGYLFTSNGRTPVSGFSKIKRRVDEKMINLARKEVSEAGGKPASVTIPEWRLHDLRRTTVSGMARAGADLHVIERAVNHVSGSFAGIVGTYQRHRYFEEVRASLEAWANLLRQITTGVPAAKVITMRTGVAK